MNAARDWNRCRFDPAMTGGHYESYFLRANHAWQPLAFWVRYTIFAPRHRYDDALGELWAIWFDGERGVIHAAKSEMPLAQCEFSRERLNVRIGTSTLTERQADGQIRGHTELQWSLRYACDDAPLLLLPASLYERPFPKAKAVVSAPNAAFDGWFKVDGVDMPIDGWVGSQNHNWGSRHTDEYAWGQVAGFDDADDVFLECSSARVQVGPLRTPWLTLAVLRLDGEDLCLNSLWQAWRASERMRFFDWSFETSRNDVRVCVRIHAERESFVALPYYNPPGGTKTCLNTKLAACELTIERPGQPVRRLRSANRAAFEILTDRTDHGVAFGV